MTEQTKSSLVNFRAEPPKVAEYHAFVQRQGMTLSEWIRTKLEEGIAKEKQ